jgi:predicted DNA-binding transcriptional regulator AlpA
MRPSEYDPVVSCGGSRPKLDTMRAAEFLGLSSSTLNKLRVRGGGPPYLKLGRRVVYDTADLEAWSASRRRTSTSEAGW